MAITANAHSALQDLSWDEAIVPSLKKRLESESRAISKRMSAASIVTGEDGTIQYSQKAQPRTSFSSNRTGKSGRMTPSSTSTERPSAIPRPSLNYSRPLADSSNVKRPQPQQQQRSRTFSQPYVFDAALTSTANGPSENSNPSTRTTNALPTPASSRSNSPATPYPPVSDAKAYAKTRGGPTGRTTPTPNRPMQMQEEYEEDRGYHQEEWDEEDTFDASYSSINVDIPRHGKQNGIMHESAPFSANSSFASEAEVRPSLEERPFEHWYRGDLSRNGGVGELRVGNRMEMLEIANYGHKLRNVTNESLSRRRRRAESIGHRESVVFSEEPYDSGPMVLDEAPLTDMEGDTELETDREMSFTKQLEQPKRNATQSLSPTTPMKPRQPSQIPRATPTAVRTTQRTASEPLQAQLSASTSSIPPSRSRSPGNAISAAGRIPHSHSQAASPAQKRGRTKSPAVVPAGKKPRPSAAQQKRSKSAANFPTEPREVSEYPELPDGGDMADAIPSWTQPNKKAGNWDDLVLPAVARKMGLDDQIEEADGSPKPPARQSQEIIPPQPGTFNIDHSKQYRPRFNIFTGEEIPMDDLENVQEDPDPSPPPPPVVVDKNETRKSKRFSKAANPSHRPPVINTVPESKQPANQYSVPASPPPFSQYSGTPTGNGNLNVDHEPAMEEESKGGCCGCIIM